MLLKKLRKAVGLLLAGAMLITAVPAAPLTVTAESRMAWEDKENPTLRDYATPSVSYVGWGAGADRFADEDMGSFWNGHSDPELANYDQWMMYDFGERKAEITGSDITFYDDGGGVITPTNITIEYAAADGSWQEVTQKGEWVFKKNETVTYEFEPVTTSKIRVTMEHARLNNVKVAVAVYDWKLLGDVPEDFPKPTPVEPEQPSEDLKLPDAAVYAMPSSDYTSDWENVYGINNADFEPTSSDTGTGKGWGNWPQQAGSEHWLQYTWDADVTAKTFQVYWYGSDAGMKLPARVRFEYQDADGKWQDAKLVSDSRNFLKYNKYNQITIEEVTTKAIRMYMTVAGDSNGVYRWKVHSNISDDFVVSAAGSSLVIPEVKEGRVSSRIYKTLTLPTKAMNNLVDVSWKSGNTAVVADDGKISPPSQDTEVTLTATCTLALDPSIRKEKDVKFLVLSDKTTEYAMTIDQEDRGVDISQELYGVFYEDINSSADGGLSSELVKNNSFENYQNIHSTTSPEVKGNQASWKLHWDSASSANFVVERTAGLNDNNKNYAKITGNQTLSNHGFVGRATLDKSAMAIRKDAEYAFSMFMKADSTYAGTVKVKVVDDSGAALTDEAALELKKDGTWQKVSASLTGSDTRLGTLVLTFEGAGAADAMYIDMVSLIPKDSYGYGNKNYSYGAGLRKDLVEKLQQLNPSFIRFPGGCVVEGSYGTDGYYNWEDSVGPLEARRAIGSYWGSPWKSVNYGTAQDKYGYMMSYQFGYHEILTLCEDLGAQAFPILSAGIFCQFTEASSASFSGEALKPFADHATHLIDYCWGDPDSSDATQAYWAKKRVENGHAAAFDLNYLGIGNENWEEPAKGISYFANFTWIKNYVEDYIKAHYPGRKLTLISSTGPYYQGGQGTQAWNWVNSSMPGETLVDEHYYINYAGDGSNTLLNGDYIYDGYKRLEEGGSNVFVGEYAGHLTTTKENVLDTAISEAAYMTGIERNADIVRHASYAPLFEREGCRDWDYNLIKFDAYSSYGTPSYYVQTMYSNNYGKHILNTTLEKYNSQTGVYDKKPGHQTELYYVTSEDEENIYTKLVNHDDFAKEITLNYPGVQDGTKVELIRLSGNAMDKNTITEQTKIAPVTTETVLNGGSMTYVAPAMSLTVVKVKYNEGGQPAQADKTALESLVNSIEEKLKGLTQSDYTAESWSSLQSALASAKSALGNAEATKEQVDTAKAALEEANRKLEKKPVVVPAVDKTKLNSTINSAKKYKKDNYTAATWKTFSTALSAAKKVASNKDAAQRQVDDANSKLQKAIKALVKLRVTATKKATFGKGEKYSVAAKNCTYTTTNKKVAAVSSKGAVVMKGTGKATIKAINKNGKVTVYYFTVKKAPAKISKVTPSKKTLKRGKKITLKVVLPSGTASNKMTFTSSNKKVATVNAKGVVTAKKKKGKAIITVKTFNGKKKKVTITVK